MEQTTLLTINERMTSLEIAEVTGKEHKNIMRDIRSILEQGVCQLNFELSSYKQNLPNGGTKDVPMYSLTKKGCLILASGYDALLREKIINRWEELETKEQTAQLPTTYLEALKALVASEEKKQALELENKVMKPKADYFDDLVERNMLTGLRDTAKELGWKQNAFINQLTKDGYLYRNNNKSLRPVAEYANDLFVLKDSKSDKTKWVGVQTMITPKGKETFRLLYMGKAEEQ